VTEPRSTDASDNQALPEQLAKTAADLRVLGEQLGAVPPGEPKVYSLQRARFTFGVVIVLAVLVGWLIWSHGHALLGLFLPLVWIFAHAWRFQRRENSRS
jgi:hypothetical protein